MSSQAEVRVVGGSLAVICGGAALVGAAVVGLAAGIPIILYQGGVLIGKKLEENYEEVCKLWIAQYDAAEAEARRNVQNVNAGPATADEIAFGRANLSPSWTT